jgi:hypothetical protein
MNSMTLEAHWIEEGRKRDAACRRWLVQVYHPRLGMRTRMVDGDEDAAKRVERELLAVEGSWTICRMGATA